MIRGTPAARRREAGKRQGKRRASEEAARRAGGLGRGLQRWRLPTSERLSFVSFPKEGAPPVCASIGGGGGGGRRQREARAVRLRDRHGRGDGDRIHDAVLVLVHLVLDLRSHAAGNTAGEAVGGTVDQVCQLGRPLVEHGDDVHHTREQLEAVGARDELVVAWVGAHLVIRGGEGEWSFTGGIYWPAPRDLGQSRAACFLSIRWMRAMEREKTGQQHPSRKRAAGEPAERCECV